MPKLMLTVKEIKSLPIPEKGRADYQDAALPGLILRVSPSGRKTFEPQECGQFRAFLWLSSI